MGDAFPFVGPRAKKRAGLSRMLTHLTRTVMGPWHCSTLTPVSGRLDDIHSSTSNRNSNRKRNDEPFTVSSSPRQHGKLEQPFDQLRSAPLDNSTGALGTNTSLSSSLHIRTRSQKSSVSHVKLSALQSGCTDQIDPDSGVRNSGFAARTLASAARHQTSEEPAAAAVADRGQGWVFT